MRSSKRLTSPPKTRKPRRSPLTATKRGSTIFVNNGTDEDTLTTRRAQRLSLMFGLPEPRARVIASLAFGGVHG